MSKTVHAVALLLFLTAVSRADVATPLGTASPIVTAPGMTNPVAADEAATGPGFVTLDRGDATSRLGIEASYLAFADSPGMTALRLDVHGQYVDPRSGFGGYLQMPLGYIDGAYGATSSLAGVGDLEVGGLYVTHIPATGFAFVLRAGVTAPTGWTNDSRTVSTSLARLTDVYLMVPDATSLRVSTSLLWRRGMVFTRADLGIDTNLSADSEYSLDTFVRVNLGLGVDFGKASLTLESTNVFDHNLDGGSGWISTVALAARVRTGHLDIYGALVLPNSNANEVGALITDCGGSTLSAAITLGVEGRL